MFAGPDTRSALPRHFAYLEEAVAAARQAMLSRRKAMLAAYLVDAFVDRLFAVRAEPAGDILVFRAGIASAHPPLGLVLGLVAGRAELLIQAVEVPLADYGKLSVEDFMVSLYNQHSVQRLRIATPDGGREDVHAVLAAAVAALAEEGGRPPT
jgi:hypothetical protein